MRDERVYIGTLSWTRAMWVHDGEFERLDADASPEELGSAVLMAISRSTTVAPPEPTKKHLAPLLRASKTKTWSSFMDGARLVHIDNEPGGYELTPMENEGPRKGFTFIQAKLARLPNDATAEQLGDALVRALSNAIAWSS